MAYAGQTISNPVSGERITFVKTAADTNGELLAIDMTLAADGHVPGAHVHPEQEERFEVVSGTMVFRMGRQEGRRRPRRRRRRPARRHPQVPQRRRRARPACSSRSGRR